VVVQQPWRRSGCNRIYWSARDERDSLQPLTGSNTTFLAQPYGAATREQLLQGTDSPGGVRVTRARGLDRFAVFDRPLCRTLDALI